MALVKLPGWVIDPDASVRDEMREWAGASPAERWKATQRCASAAARVLRFHADPRRALEWVDPLPDSSVAALTRLRAAHSR